ncbi:cupin domain-containing protein [Phanerochaete sordida]|uniref:Cupin domain-containing protein n=1 Tax=Phanerochaete sordida TaxID=48140 RepID=A0A9P3FZK7_9APHY|nr:cupin domain-containing protein [Phanerochaete sordida]
MAGQPELPSVVRIVTTHNASGRSAVQINDSIALLPSESFPGVKSRILWTSASVPAKDNNVGMDETQRQPDGDLGIVQRGGTVCNMTDLAPGATAIWHRTSSLDYNVLISGRLIHMLEDGSEQSIDQPGTVLVQKGTMHSWRNPGPEWARWVCVLVDAEPAVVNGERLKSVIVRE